MPKTGGKWVREVLKSVTTNSFGHKLPTTEFARPYVYVFVRNPWQWYNSLYHYLIYGSDIHTPNDKFVDPLIRAFGHTPSFPEFIETLCCPPDMYKKKVSILSSTFEKSSPISQSPIHRAWLENSGSLYNTISTEFINHATDVGTTENIANDLRRMTIESKDFNSKIDHLLNSVQHKNVGKQLVDYRKLYTDNLKDLVAVTSETLINQFNYKF